MTRHPCAALALMLAAALIAPPVLAAPAAAPQVSIAHADLDLATPAGAQVMLTRIRNAATAVCRAGEAASHDSATLERLDACYRQSVGRAVRTLDAALVTAAAGRRGLTVAPALLAQNSVRAGEK